jgi:hypothetical protein
VSKLRWLDRVLNYLVPNMASTGVPIRDVGYLPVQSIWLRALLADAGLQEGLRRTPSYGLFSHIIPVYTENSIPIDRLTESPNVSA